MIISMYLDNNLILILLPLKWHVRISYFLPHYLLYLLHNLTKIHIFKEPENEQLT